MEPDIKKYIGVANTAITKKDAITDIEVYLPKFQPFTSGVKGNDKLIDNNVTITDLDKGIRNINIKTADTVKCTYYGSEAYSNIPDIHIGELVEVTCILDTMKFYWLPIGISEKIRHTEHKKIAVMNKQLTTKEITDDNSYYIELDTKYNKHIHIHTSNSDGEKYIYDIKINSVTNSVSINDNIGNSIELHSDNHQVLLRNTDKSIVNLLKTNIFIEAINDINISAGNNINMKSNKTINEVSKTINRSADYINNNAKLKSISSGASFDMNATQVGIQGGTLNIKGNKVTIFGTKLTISGAGGTGGSVSNHSKVVFP